MITGILLLVNVLGIYIHYRDKEYKISLIYSFVFGLLVMGYTLQLTNNLQDCGIINEQIEEELHDA